MYKVLGISDERTECECCGRKGLKRTVALDRTDAEGNATGDVVYFGVDCAGAAVHCRKTSSNTTKVKNAAAAYETEQKAIRRNKLARVATEKNRANYLYSSTRRGIEGSYFAFRGDEVVRVDGKDAEDVAFFLAEGFTR